VLKIKIPEDTPSGIEYNLFNLLSSGLFLQNAVAIF